jgi:putative solute:sodium symporter small subunit
MSDEDVKQAYWRRTRRLTLGVTIILAALTMVLPLFTPELNAYRFLRFPLGYFLLTDGAVLALALLVYGFFNGQRETDRAYNVTIQF